MIDGARRKYDKEIGLHVVPSYASKATDFGVDHLLIDLKLHLIAEFNTQPVCVLLFD